MPDAPADHRKKPVPPPRPVPLSLLMPSRYNDELFWEGFKRSAAVHSGLAILAVIVAVVVPREPAKFLPSIRVDLVSLPDFKKSDNLDLGDKTAQAKPREQAKVNKTAEPAPKPVAVTPVKPAPDQMVLKKEKPTTKKRGKGNSLDAAINNIKALEEIESQVDSNKTKGTAPKTTVSTAKGNQIAHGDSLTGVAGTDTNAFISKMRDRLQDNWNLPVWLTTKNLSAQVMVFLDRSGFVTNLLLKQSSGNAQFDDYCVKTVRMSQPFGAPPDGLVNSGIVLGFPL